MLNECYVESETFVTLSIPDSIQKIAICPFWQFIAIVISFALLNCETVAYYARFYVNFLISELSHFINEIIYGIHVISASQQQQNTHTHLNLT